MDESSRGAMSRSVTARPLLTAAVVSAQSGSVFSGGAGSGGPYWMSFSPWPIPSYFAGSVVYRGRGIVDGGRRAQNTRASQSTGPQLWSIVTDEARQFDDLGIQGHRDAVSPRPETHGLYWALI